MKKKKVYYAFGLAELTFHEKDYRMAIKAIESKGHTLTRNDIDEDLKHIRSGKLPPIRAKKYDTIIQNISEADVCIFDISSKSLAIGQQIEIALQKKKPVLVLSNLNNTDSIKVLFISGCNVQNLHLSDYTNKPELKELITDFLNNDFTKKKVRMNFFLEASLHDEIEKQAKETGKTKTDIIKEALIKKN